MSDFIEVTDGVYIKKECIVAVIDNKDGTVSIKTEMNSYEVTADALAIMSVLDEETAREEQVKRFTTQFFGG